MAITYENLDENDKGRIRNDIASRDADTTDYDAFLPGWEAEHFSHTVLLEQATAAGDEDAIEAAQEAIAALEEAITNVRAGLRPDGTPRPTPPAPPAPTPPAPTDPTPPAPQVTDGDTEPTGRRTTKSS